MSISFEKTDAPISYDFDRTGCAMIQFLSGSDGETIALVVHDTQAEGRQCLWRYYCLAYVMQGNALVLLQTGGGFGYETLGEAREVFWNRINQYLKGDESSEICWYLKKKEEDQRMARWFEKYQRLFR